MMLGSILMYGGHSAPDAMAAEQAAAPSNYTLSQDLRAAVKSVAVKTTTQGTQLSATIRIYNGGTASKRVPDYELHAAASNGLTFTLTPSSGNKPSLQPNEFAELVYMSVIDTKEPLQIDKLTLTHVDLYTYPKVEKELLSMDVRSKVWYETGTGPIQLRTLPWRETFSIPGVNSGIVYTAAGYAEQHTAEGTFKIVTLLAENKGAGSEAVPSFRIDALSDNKIYEGRRVDTETVPLQPGEKSYVRFAIPVETGAVWSQLLVSSIDDFVSGTGGATTVIATGKLGIALPSSAAGSLAAARPYELGKPISFDPLTKVIDQRTEIALVELHLHENPDEGYQTAIAKFKLTNTGDTPLALPAFQTNLTNEQGMTYTGVRQMNVRTTMDPGLSYVVSYAFRLPPSEEGERLTLQLLDPGAAAPFATEIAALKTTVQRQDIGNEFSIYPYNIKVNGLMTGFNYSLATLQYNYVFNLDLGLSQQDNVIIDNNFSKLRIEVVDGLGRIVGATDLPFTGPQKLINGLQKINASNLQADQTASSLTVNLYEVLQTADGEAKRLVYTYRK